MIYRLVAGVCAALAVVIIVPAQAHAEPGRVPAPV